jgi:hypothetical protein
MMVSQIGTQVSDGAKWVWRLFGGRRKRRDEFAV